MPDFRKLVRERFAFLRIAAAAETDLVEEFAQHLEDLYRESLAAGATDEAALRKASSELDNLYPVRAGLKQSQQMPSHEPVPFGDHTRSNLLSDLWRDLRYSARMIRQNLLFSGFVVMTLALGIGANTTVFTVINSLVLNPVPVRDTPGLSAVAELKTNDKTGTLLPLSYANFKDYQARNEVFESLAGYSGAYPVTWEGEGAPQRMFAQLVTANYFPTLGLLPAKGRFFLADEDSVRGGHAVAVLNYATWQARFGGSQDVLGKTLRLNHVVFTIVGVAPPGFIGLSSLFGPDIWVPATMAEQLLPSEMQASLTDRSKTAFQGVGRRKPEVGLQQAQANFSALAAALAREYPSASEGHTVAVRPITDAIFGNSPMMGRTALMFGSIVLIAVVGLILLIACSNVANLLLARSASRRQEIAVRLAMGASRWRLVRQLLTESLVLALLSGAAGMGVGYAGSQLLWSLRPAEVYTNFTTMKMDATVFGYALFISVATGLLFGILPALRTSRVTVAETLKEESRTTGRNRRKITFANALLVAQVAFSFVALVTASLFLRSIERAYDIDPGFQTRHLAVFMTNPGQAGYSKAQTMAFYKDVRDRMAGLPGVESASWSSNLPLWARVVNGLEVEGHQPRSRADSISSAVNTVDREYFRTAGIELSRGRDFTDMDQDGSTPVAIVNQKLAQAYWPGQEALGKHIRLPGETAQRQVVGIAKNANYSNLGEQPQICVYVPLKQSYSGAMVLYVRTKGDPQQTLLAVQRGVREVGPQIMVDDVRTGSKIIDQALFAPRAGVALLSVFGLLALALASIGLYGLLAYSVNRRRREIGLRMALGAAQQNVLRLVVAEGMRLVLTGVGIGVVGALLLSRLLGGMLYGVNAGDPLSLGVAALVLLVVAALACYLPARSASRVDPLVALRDS